MEFTVYIQSRGVGPERDYTWVQIFSDNEGQVLQEPSVLKDFGILDMIEGESLVIGRYNEQLVLLITELATKERADFQNRRIRNSLLCMAEETQENENILRGVAGKFLTEKFLLERVLDECVQSDSQNEAGFSVSEELVEKLFTFRSEGDKTGTNWNNKTISENTETTREELADELLNYQLPTARGPLIVVTQNKASTIFEERKVWRSLCNIVVSKKKVDDTDINLKSVYSKLKPSTKLWLGLIAIGIVVFLLTRDRTDPQVTNFAISLNKTSVVEMSLPTKISQPIPIPRLGENLSIDLQFNEVMSSKKQPQLTIVQREELLNQQQSFPCVLKDKQSWECSVNLSNTVPNQLVDIGLTIQEAQDRAGNSMKPVSLELQIESVDIHVELISPIKVFHRNEQSLASVIIKVTGKYPIADVYIGDILAVKSQELNLWEVELPLKNLQEPSIVRIKDIHGNMLGTNLFYFE